MAFLPPFAVDGAQITGAQLRQHLFQTVKGETGVLGPDSLKAVAVPGSPGVLGIMPGVGAVSVPSRREAYQVSNPAMDGDALLTVPAAGAGGATWHVIVEVTDPQYQGSTPDVEARLVSSLAGLTKPYLYLASFTLPAGGGFGVATPITDQRRIAAPRTHRDVKTVPGVAEGQNLTSSSFVAWPAQTVTVDVPSWASYVVARAEILAGHFGGADVDGELRMLIGASAGSGKVIGLQGYNLDWGTDPQRVSLLVVGETSIAESMGLTRTLTLQGRRTSGAGFLGTVSRSYVLWDVQFQERAL